MKIHDLIQGTPEWLQYRSEMHNASDAAAMMGLSKNTKRNELLHIYSTGITKEFTDYVQRMILDKGHEVEAMARPIIEALIGEDLYPVVGSVGKISASCDGLTMDDSIAFEHKQFNGAYAEMVRAGELPEEHWPQCQQVLYVTGAKQLIFALSDGTENNFAWMWVYPDKAKQDLLLASWAQFEKDLADYVPTVYAPVAVADAIISLPSVIMQVKGELTACNFYDIRKDWDAFIANAAVNLVKDEDFTRADAESKEARSTAKKCLAVVRGVIDQTLSISEVTRELELYAAKFNALALQQEKAVKSQKEARKVEIVTEAKLKFSEHLKALELEIMPIRLITGQPDFNGAMKNKRLISAWQDAVDTELAKVKIEADGIAKSLRHNLAVFNVMAINHKNLFADLQTLVYESFGNFDLFVRTRIEAQAKAETERLEAQRLQMQRDEEAKATRKAEAEQAEKLEQERKKVRDEETARIAEERRLERIEFDKRRETERLSNIELQRIESERKAATREDAKQDQSIDLTATKSILRNADKKLESEPFGYATEENAPGFVSITINEYDALKADSDRLNKIISHHNQAKQIRESAERAPNSVTRNEELRAAQVHDRAIKELIEE